MRPAAGVERVLVSATSSPSEGRIAWAPAKSLWIGGMSLTALIAGPLLFSPSAFVLFVVTTGVTLCLGHSVGMHRKLIHKSFECPLWTERLLVYLGVLVGMAGPSGMVRTHDVRDWAQRQSACHPYLRHGAGFLLDGWRQLHCQLRLDDPPGFRLEPELAGDRFYRFLERTWMLQQAPWALVFYAFGGWGWVVWGVCARVAVSVTGHWLVGYFAHREGPQTWVVHGASAQGHNVVIAGLVSMGESWHNNHHAYPGSAKLGLHPGQVDLGWTVICVLERLGLAWNIRLPADLPQRPELRRTGCDGGGCPVMRSLPSGRRVATPG
jgi:fatty-acid desaturase